MACWICAHHAPSVVTRDVGTCVECGIHACDDHGERLASDKFRCAINTAKILYTSLTFAHPVATPLAPAGLQATGPFRPGPLISQRSAEHRHHWREHLPRVLPFAAQDPHSPWYQRDVDFDEPTMKALADLVGLVAWYLGLAPSQPFPSRSNAAALDETDDPRLAIARLMQWLNVTPAEVVYLLRYYSEATIPQDTEPDWGLGDDLWAYLRENPFAR
jgi:hypothetical protein